MSATRTTGKADTPAGPEPVTVLDCIISAEANATNEELRARRPRTRPGDRVIATNNARLARATMEFLRQREYLLTAAKAVLACPSTKPYLLIEPYNSLCAAVTKAEGR